MGIITCRYHGYILKSTKKSSKCIVCYEDPHDDKQGFKCPSCGIYVHEECDNANIPSRHKHPLKLTNNYKRCCLCKSRGVHICYECLQCLFYICLPCARKPLIFPHTKAHEHQLHQVPIEVSFTCDACGLQSTDYPCFCLQCCFIIHRACISIPRVIYINRHDHRIYHVSSLGYGTWICGVCYESVNRKYGAYSCSACSFVVHSKCATNANIWDGIELEGVPEQDEKEESKPFEVIDQNWIKHFSHEHNLKVSSSSSRLEEPRECCYACTLPLYSELCYKCTQCDFILHVACANLPLKKRHEISTQKLTLRYKNQHDADIGNFFFCVTCRRFRTGFFYKSDCKFGYIIDVRCASVSDSFKHESHPHWLFVIYDESFRVSCENCNICCCVYLCCKEKDYCGGYNLCFACATLPTSVRHKYDYDHPLSLCYDEKNVNATYYCGICEEEINSKIWFYKCDECGSTLHTKCVFSNLIHAIPGSSILVSRTYRKYMSYLLLNNHLSLSRPICYLCKTRCMDDLVLNNKVDTSEFLCCSCGFSSFIPSGILKIYTSRERFTPQSYGGN